LGADFASSDGGEIVLTDLAFDRNTSDLINRARARWNANPPPLARVGTLCNLRGEMGISGSL